jgi:hypothetical protein
VNHLLSGLRWEMFVEPAFWAEGGVERWGLCPEPIDRPINWGNRAFLLDVGEGKRENYYLNAEYRNIYTSRLGERGLSSVTRRVELSTTHLA